MGAVLNRHRLASLRIQRNLKHESFCWKSSHAHAPTRGPGEGLLGVATTPFQGPAQWSQVRQDRFREDLDRSGTDAGLRMRLVRASAHDLGGGLPGDGEHRPSYP